MKPLLSVICLCYNQRAFVEQALASVFSQQNVNFEVIVVDDASDDGSDNLLLKLGEEFLFKKLILHEQNVGNCKSFNEGLKFAEGEFVIDFACDDYFLPKAFEQQMFFFQNQINEVGLMFSNLKLVNENNEFLNYHFPIDKEGRSVEYVPQGRVFKDVLERYFISPTVMVMRKSWLDQLGGYNEALSYEDFDIWIRGSLISEFKYLDKVLAVKRVHATQFSKRILSKRGKEICASTLKVCEYAQKQLKSEGDVEAMLKRLSYEGRNAAFFQFNEEVIGYKKLMRLNGGFSYYISMKWRVFSLVGKLISHLWK